MSRSDALERRCRDVARDDGEGRVAEAAGKRARVKEVGALHRDGRSSVDLPKMERVGIACGVSRARACEELRLPRGSALD